MNRNILIGAVLIAVAGGAAYVWYQSGQPSESERGLIESCLLSEQMLDISSALSSRIVISQTQDGFDRCSNARRELGPRKVKKITDEWREEMAFEMNYGTPPPPFDPNAPVAPAPAAR